MLGGSSLVHTCACNLYLPSGASGGLNLTCRWYRRHCLLEKDVSYFLPGFKEVTNVSLFFITVWLLYFSQLSVKVCLTETESPGLCVSVIYMQGRSLPSFKRWLMPSALCTRFFHSPETAQGVGAFSWALPMSNRPLIQWCFKSCAKAGVCKQPHQLVAQFTDVANSTKPALWTNRSWSCFRQLWCMTLCKVSPTTNAVVALALL